VPAAPAAFGTFRWRRKAALDPAAIDWAGTFPVRHRPDQIAAVPGFLLR